MSLPVELGHRFIWQGIKVEVRYAAQCFGGVIAHLELHTTPRQKLPVTDSGYQTHFLPCGIVEAEGGPVAYAQAWLDHEAQSPEWQAHPAAQRQLTSF